MKQYKISFYRNGFVYPSATYYREFDNKKELKAWVNDIMSNDSLYCRYVFKEITLSEFLSNNNTPTY